MSGEQGTEKYVMILCEPRDDGSIFVSSPQLRYFSAVIRGESEIDSALAILRESLNANEGPGWEVRLVEEFPGDAPAPRPHLAAHVIAAMAG